MQIKNTQLLQSCLLRTVVLALGVFALTSEAVAQQLQDGVRIQGRDPLSTSIPLPVQTGPILDFREELRTYVQRVSTYARSQKNDFIIVARDAGDLLIKRDVQDEKIISPARTFMRSIDGIMFDGLFVGHQRVGQVPPPEIQQIHKQRIERAKRGGMKTLSMEFAAKPTEIDNAYRQARSQNIVSNVVHRPTPDLSELPPHPRRPHDENPNNVLSLNDVKNFAYISEPGAWGRQDQFALDMHDTNFDLIIVDPFAGREPLSRSAVETLKYKKLGARRLVFARMDIGTVASYRYYWKPEWREGSPFWIAGPYPGDPDRYFVEYWRLGWQDVMFGNENSYLFGLIRQGYDGVVIEGLRSYLAFEGNVEIPQAFAPLEYPAN